MNEIELLKEILDNLMKLKWVVIIGLGCCMGKIFADIFGLGKK